MDEKIPPLATYPPPPKSRDPKSGVSPVVFLIAGVAIGGALVLAAMKMSRQNGPPVTYGNAVTQKQADPKTGVNDPAPKSIPTEPDRAAKDPAKVGEAELKPGIGETPFNPFEGSIGSGMPTSEMSGRIDTAAPPSGSASKGSIKTMGREPFGGKPVEEVDTTPRGYLAIIRLDVENPESAVGAVQGVASKLGGSAIQFDETAKRQEPEGAILFVPLAKAEEAQKLLGGVGSVVVSDTWNGSSGARLDRIENDAQNHLSDLRIKRQELLVKYFEDAPQIKHIDEDADRINKCIGALRARKPGPDTAVFKIKFLG